MVWAGVAVVVVAIAGLGYGLTGTPGEIGKAPAGFAAAEGGSADGAAAPHALGREQMEDMVAKLAARMQTAAKEAFDLSSEPEYIKKMYGLDQDKTRD